MGNEVAYGIEIAVDRAHTSIACAGRGRDGRIVVELAAYLEGTNHAGLLRDMVLGRGKGKVLAVMIDPRSPAATLVEPLEALRVEFTLADVHTMAAAHGDFSDQLRAGTLAVEPTGADRRGTTRHGPPAVRCRGARASQTGRRHVSDRRRRVGRLGRAACRATCAAYPRLRSDGRWEEMMRKDQDAAPRDITGDPGRSGTPGGPTGVGSLGRSNLRGPKRKSRCPDRASNRRNGHEQGASRNRRTWDARRRGDERGSDTRPDERETAMKEDGMDIEPNEGRELVHRVAKEWVREAELIPIRHLSLDLAEPINGWEMALLQRGVEIVDDDLGRPCVRREVLSDLLREEDQPPSRAVRIRLRGRSRRAQGPPVGQARPGRGLRLGRVRRLRHRLAGSALRRERRVTTASAPGAGPMRRHVQRT